MAANAVAAAEETVDAADVAPPDDHDEPGVDEMESDAEEQLSSSGASSSSDDSSSSSSRDGEDPEEPSESKVLGCTLVHPEYVDCSKIPNGASQEDVDVAIVSARRGIHPSDLLSRAALEGEPGVFRRSTVNKATFPTALFDILADPELDDIITWLPHGRSWRMVDVDKFTEQVLSSYFKQTKYTSFIRQVNGWGFRRVQSGSEINTYYHELFLRGKVSHVLYCMGLAISWNGCMINSMASKGR